MLGEAVAAVAGVPEGLAEEEFGFGVAGAVGAHGAGCGVAQGGDGGTFVADVADEKSLIDKGEKGEG